MYFYYEVYDPTLDAAGLPKIKTSLAFYRGRVKVFETPIVERIAIDDVERKAAIFQFALQRLISNPACIRARSTSSTRSRASSRSRDWPSTGGGMWRAANHEIRASNHVEIDHQPHRRQEGEQ